MYQVTATQQGATVATFNGIIAQDALAACEQAEKQMGLKAQKMQLGDKENSTVVVWTGYEFTARRVN